MDLRFSLVAEHRKVIPRGGAGVTKNLYKNHRL
jgi:hypothetical protein